ncbi:cysteine dioxygenase [Streptomyces radicis]|uniref:Cysteine dioxygenase n=1 Tax=Streptomyces radicis TaxID=1750517 RepID=A0A3A9VRC0_9ACTN|nr:cysteine dioxygenase family protein [Streptomyces radicis]RKN03309.1 cysteine dioxygenase [Streptomyces radicis]RKN13186.1 cysteine dioxygenase [Streptomyces radicis]
MSAPTPAIITPAELELTVRSFAARTDLWRPQVRFTRPDRWYRRLERNADFEVWLLTWLPGQGTEIHDHGGSSGAFGVVQGTLTERVFPAAGPVVRQVDVGGVRPFGPHYVHEVTNRGGGPAVSIHAYAPALTTQSYYRWDADGGLALSRTEPVTE